MSMIRRPLCMQIGFGIDCPLYLHHTQLCLEGGDVEDGELYGQTYLDPSYITVDNEVRWLTLKLFPPLNGFVCPPLLCQDKGQRDRWVSVDVYIGVCCTL